MHELIAIVLFVFGIVAFGYLASLTGFLKGEVGEGLTEFAVSVGLPLLLFRTISTADLGDKIPVDLWVTYFSAVFLAWGAGFAGLKILFGRDARNAVVGGLAAAFSNLLMIGTPLSLGVYGQAGFTTLSLIIAIHLPIMMGLSIILFELARPADSQRPGIGTILLDFLRKLVSNAILVGIAAGFTWRLVGRPLPDILHRIVDVFADASVPIALFAMGMALRRFKITNNVGPVMWIASVKLAFMPAVVMCLALLLQMPPLSAKVAVLAAATSTGINPYLIASRFGTGQTVTSNAMTVSTAFAVVSTAVWLFIAEHVFA